MKVKSRFYRWMTDTLGLNWDIEDDDFGFISLSVILALVGSFVGFALTQTLKISAWYLLFCTGLCIYPFLACLIEILIRIGAAKAKELLSWGSGKAHKRATEKALKKLWAGQFDEERAKELFPTDESTITDKLLKDACIEFFTDQLQRSLEKDESVTVTVVDRFDDGEVLVLATLIKKDAIENGRGATQNTFECVSAGIRYRLLPEHSMLKPEFIQAFKRGMFMKQMVSILHDTVEIRRQSERTIERAYEPNSLAAYPSPSVSKPIEPATKQAPRISTT